MKKHQIVIIGEYYCRRVIIFGQLHGNSSVSEDVGSMPGWVILKTLTKWYLCLIYLALSINIYHILVKFSRWQTDAVFLKKFPENRLWPFMQIVPFGDNLHERSKPISWKVKAYFLEKKKKKKIRKIFQMSSAEYFFQHSEC